MLLWLLYHNLSCQLYQYCKIILAVTYIDIFLNQLLHAIARTRIGVGLKILPDKFNSINQFNYHIFSPNFFFKICFPFSDEWVFQRIKLYINQDSKFSYFSLF